MFVITQEQIEENIANYIAREGHKPKFLLLDSESFKAFTKVCYAKERILDRDGIILSEENPPNIEKLYSSWDCVVQILSVDNKSDLFELTR